MDLQLVCYFMLLVIFISVPSLSAMEIHVRLVNGSSHYEGTVEYSADGETWNTLCGRQTNLNEVKVICRQLGFPGANRYMRDSPSGSLSSQSKIGFSCVGNETLLEQCQLNSLCSSTTTVTAPLVSAKCYDERYLGCFKDTVQSRIFSEDNRLISSTMTIQICIDHCKKSKISYAFAGVELRNECYCGVANVNYSRLGVGGDEDCQFTCDGDMTSSCGGTGFIAVFDLSVNVSVITNPPPSSTVPSTTTFMQTTDQEAPTLKRGLTSRNAVFQSDILTFAGVQSTLMSTLVPETGDKSGIALYAGAGGGGAFLLILIIIIIVCVTCRRRNTEKRSAATDHPLTTMIPTKNDNQERNRPAGQEEDPCYENKCAETERDYENMTVVDTREYINLPDAMDNKEITYMNSKKRSAMEKATHDPAALYAMPNLSAKTSSRPKTYTSPPNGTDDPSLLYAMPDKRTKTVYSTKGKPALEESLDALYTTSTKNRLEPIGMEASTDGEGLYALPDKNPRDHVTRNGAGKLDDNVEAMYAMPEKSRRGSDVDNTVMIENYIYSST